MNRSALRALFAALVVAVWTIATDARADDDLPPTLLAQLAMKVAAYDKNQAERQKTHPRVLVFVRPFVDRSVRTATMVVSALRDPEIGKGVPVELVAFTSASEVAAAIDSRAASILIFATGLEDEMGGIARAVANKDVLTIGTTGALAEKGAVVGFEVREGKPKIVVNLAQTRAQNVAFKSELLALARLVQ